ncbi:MAG: hypothetical protein IJ501_02270 [Bacilli bacterium]|nr:hypothetical protein [Bacilli bacterium]
MKKLLCYLGILVLFILAFLPPALRIFLPDKGEEKKDEEVIERSVLSCSSDTFITNTSYENNKIQMILVKKLNQVDESGNPIEEDLTSALNLTFTDLKDEGDIVYTETDDGEVIQIDFSVTTHDYLSIKNLTKGILDQKTYYEQQGLTCTIRK